MSIGNHVILVTGANVAGMALQLASLPIISRYVLPSTFGGFILFVGACSLLSILAGLRYDAAIVIARHDSQALRVARLVLLLGLATAVITIIIGWPALFLFGSMDASQAALLVALAVIYLLSNTAVRIAISWLTRQARFSWVGVIQFTGVGLTVGFQVALLASGTDELFALAGGFAIGQTFAFILAFAAPSQCWFGRGRRRDLVVVAVRFINFPRYMILYGLNSTLRERLVQVIIGWGAGTVSLGQFAMVQRVVGAPHALVHGSIGSVLLSHARHTSKTEVAQIAASLIELSCLVLTPLMLFLAFNAHTLTTTLFGSAWTGMANYVPWLAVAYLVLACTGFIDRLFELYGQQRAALRLDLGFSVVILSGLLLAALSANGLTMTATFGVIYLLYEIYWTYCAYRTNGLPLRSLRHATLVFVIQIPFWATVCLMLLRFDSLAQRVMIGLTLMLIVIALHYRWMGGRDAVKKLFGKLEVLR